MIGLCRSGAESGDRIRPRVTIARLLIQSGRLIESLAIMVMRPDDLVELGRRTYKSPTCIRGFSVDSMESPVLTENERAMLLSLPHQDGKLLLLGIGGGREVAPLAQHGYEITGVDFVPEMLDEARRAAAKEGIEIRCILQEMSRLSLLEEHYDVVWISHAMYSCVPISRKRVDMLRRIWDGLKPSGLLCLGFVWSKNREPRPSVQRIRRAFAAITRGNLTYEAGDGLWAYSEFMHFFTSEEELTSELARGGFEPVTVFMKKDDAFGYAVFRKMPGGGGAN